PVPRVIVARVQPGTTLDLASLRARVTQVAPTASVDDHRAWIERMRSMTGATVFAGVGILILVIVATIISVSFATRGAMAANRPIVDARGRRHLRHPRAQAREIERGAGLHPRHDHARHRQFVDREPAAEPRLEQLGALLL
ncbi:MAG: cell division protein FtsX, partial [Bradyrhizobium sp.]